MHHAAILIQPIRSHLLFMVVKMANFLTLVANPRDQIAITHQVVP